MSESVQKLGRLLLLDIITFAPTDYEWLNHFFDVSSRVLVCVSPAAILLLLFINPKIRQRKRPEDRFMFWECVLVLILLGIEIAQEIYLHLPHEVLPVFMSIAWAAVELCYMLTILQWMVFVDYSLYHSMDHVRRSYKFAVLPVLFVIAAEVIQDVLLFCSDASGAAFFVFVYGLQLAKLAVELGYIIKAIQLVSHHRKETREPRFLSLGAFIIPFVVGNLVRYYDAPMLTLGVLLTCIAVSRRERYLDRDTGFYNRQFLKFLSKYRDRKKYTEGNGILIKVPDREEVMAGILRDLKPGGSMVFVLEEKRFLIFSESLRGSAVKLAVKTFTEAAEACDPPFTPVFQTVKQQRMESAEAFACRLLEGGEDSAVPKGVTR